MIQKTSQRVKNSHSSSIIEQTHGSLSLCIRPCLKRPDSSEVCKKPHPFKTGVKTHGLVRNRYSFKTLTA